MAVFQALRAWLRSCCPSGTKYILPVEALIKLALIGLKPWAKFFSPSGATCHTSLILAPFTSKNTFSLSIARQISSKPGFKMGTQIGMLVDRVGSHGHEHQCPGPNILIISVYMDLVEGILHENQENCSE
jgi:hypothetical protein